MKRILLLLMSLMLFATAFALPNSLVVTENTQIFRIANSSTMYEATKALGDDFELYYYNDRYTVAGINENLEERLGRANILYRAAFPISERLYLVSKIAQRSEIISSEAGSIRFDLGDQILLGSPWDDAALRSKIISPFVPMDFKAMILRQNHSSHRQELPENTDIVNLVNQVNPDSVMWFIQSLQDFQTRYALAPNRLAVATWIKDQFIRMGISNATLQSFNWNGTTQYNVVAKINGSINPERYVVIGGHHDSIVNQGDAMNFAPGADDNATGTAVSLEMARVMMNSGFVPKNTIVFNTYAAEEFGLWGSKHYAQNALQNQHDILLMINHDMIGHTTQNPSNWQVRLMPYDGSMEHSQYAAQLTQQYTSLNPTYGSMNSPSSDSHSFWTRGYPVTYFFEQIFCPYYHSDLDITTYVNADYCAEVIRASTALAATYSLMVTAPSNLVVADAGNGNSLLVSWENSLDPAVVQYHLYYNTTGSNFQNPVVISPGAGANSSYLIQNLQSGTTYHIAISSVDADGNESYMIYASGTPRLIPLTPTNFVDNPAIGAVNLSWNASTELDLAGYRIYRSHYNTGNIVVFGNTPLSETQYTDVLDPNDVSYYLYSICAVDNDGNESEHSPAIRSRQVSLSQGVLIVDETIDGNGSNPFQPTGEQVNSYVNALLHPFFTSYSDLQVAEDLRLSDIGIYGSIFWHGFDQSDFDAMYRNREQIRRYVELGGKLFFSTYFPSQAIHLNSGYPITFNANSFISSAFGIGAADYNTAARFKYAQSLQPGFPSLTVDPLKTTASMNGHIFKVESISANSNATNLYSYGSDYENDSNQGALNGLPIGVSYDLGQGKIITISFPLYNMDFDDSRALVQYVFGDLFDSPLSNSDPANALVSPMQISLSGANPFVNSTGFSVKQLSSDKALTIDVYNVRGQLVRTLFKGSTDAKSLNLDWDGKDNNGNGLAAGIYLVRASQAGKSVSRKVIKLR